MPNKPKTRAYRILEIIPGVITWATFAGALIFSYAAPVWVAIYIILFDLYWVLKAVNTSMHLLSSFSKLKLHGRYDWDRKLELLRDPQFYKTNLREQIVSATSRRVKKDLTAELKRLDNLDYSGRITDYRQVYHVVILPTS